MSEPEARHFQAALIHALGRRQAAIAIAECGAAEPAFARLRNPPLQPGRLAAQCRAAGITLLIPTDPDYPALLRAVPDAPPVLYARGDLAATVRPTVALVGARRCSRAGAEVAFALAGELARRGLAVVSGLALGIDSAAHRAALQEGVTIAVIGSGVLRPYPSGNRRLLDALLSRGGLCLSEYSPTASARPYHFPERNRLISGLARGVVVVEASERSGSLITARLSLEQGREVCAVPGAVSNPLSRGCHRLLRQGAALVENADDVIEALGLEAYAAAHTGSGPGPDPGGAVAQELAPVLAAVESRVTTLDVVVAATGRDAAAAAAALVELELAGFVRQVPGGYIRRPS